MRLFKRLSGITIAGAIFFLCLCGSGARAQVAHQVFFAKTNNELHVYRITGDEPGSTMMILGGIQGDEPSGYITADLYVDTHLRKGNLIVIPRANFFSILSKNRNGADGDMNRKFAEPDGGQHGVEDEIVDILKKLIGASDVLISLHEGSGYYNSQWLSEDENPDRYGQSIVYDAEVYTGPETKGEIQLGLLARNAVEKANERIKNPRHHFKTSNHDTFSPVTRHFEQRQSASFFALSEVNIPAFGIEISKMIPDLETKIRLHRLAVNAMMEQFGIELDALGPNLAAPKLDYLLARVNQNPPFALRDGTTLALRSGDMVTVTDIIANYERGLVADIAGFGNANDLDRTMIFSQPTRIVVRKDSFVCGWVDLVLDRKVGDTTEAGGGASVGERSLSVADLKAESLIVTINGAIHTISNSSTLMVPSRGNLVLREVRTNIAMLDGEVVANFKGFVPPKSVNDGDDLLFPISLGQDLWQKYSENGDGRRYSITVTYLDNLIGQFMIELVD